MFPNPPEPAPLSAPNSPRCQQDRLYERGSTPRPAHPAGTARSHSRAARIPRVIRAACRRCDGEGLGVGGIATLPDARDTGPLNEVRGARRERQTLYAGKGQRPRLTPQNRHRARRPASRSGLLRSFPGAPSWRHPILRPHPTQADASTAPPRGMSGAECAGRLGGWG